VLADRVGAGSHRGRLRGCASVGVYPHGVEVEPESGFEERSRLGVERPARGTEHSADVVAGSRRASLRPRAGSPRAWFRQQLGAGG